MYSAVVDLSQDPRLEARLPRNADNIGEHHLCRLLRQCEHHLGMVAILKHIVESTV
jgi:hypothetical protein